MCKVEIEDVPYFNAPVYLENKEQVGKIDEIFGNLRDYFVSVKVGEGIKAKSFAKNQKVSYDKLFNYATSAVRLSHGLNYFSP